MVFKWMILGLSITGYRPVNKKAKIPHIFSEQESYFSCINYASGLRELFCRNKENDFLSKNKERNFCCVQSNHFMMGN